MDRVPAPVPRLASRAAPAARPVHRAVLPGRGDGVRRRSPPVRALPARGLRPVRRDLALAPPRPGRRRRDRRAASRRADRTADARPPPPRGQPGGSPRRRVRPPRRRTVPRARHRAPAMVDGGLRGTRPSTRTEGDDPHHPAVARRGAARRLAPPGPAVPSIGGPGSSRPGVPSRQGARSTSRRYSAHGADVIDRPERSTAAPRRPRGGLQAGASIRSRSSMRSRSQPARRPERDGDEVHEVRGEIVGDLLDRRVEASHARGAFLCAIRSTTSNGSRPSSPRSPNAGRPSDGSRSGASPSSARARRRGRRT